MLPTPPVILARPSTEEAVSLLERLTAWLLSSGIRIVLLLVVATILVALTRWAISRLVRTMMSSSSALSSVTGAALRRDKREQRLAQERREQRASTLSTVATNIAVTVIAAVTIVMILSEVGVNVAPILASLGVVGLAAGIGAQSIIKDVIAGVLMLFEDLVAVGDYVDLEYAEGTVENINLRTTQVRAMDGVLWTVRNGEIIRIGNHQRGWSMATIVLDLESSADNDRATEIFRAIAEQMQADEEWGARIIGTEPTIHNIVAMDGNRLQRRVLIKVLPGAQWEVEREFRARVHAAFQKEGIALAFPRIAEAMS